jgi:hypothetical protein
MSAPYKASFALAPSNTSILPGSLCNDLLIWTGNSNQNILFGVSNVNTYMSVSGSGNMSLSGNVAFSNQLQLSGIMLTQRTSAFTNNVTSAITALQGFAYVNGDVQITMSNVQSNAIRFLQNNTEYMRISSNGFVGIGTTNPTGRISIIGDGVYPGIVIDGISRDIGYLGNLQIGTWDGNNWSEKIRLDSVGNFGIGTTTPTAPLTVIGTGNGGGGTPIAYFLNSNGMPLIEIGSAINSNLYINYYSNLNYSQIGIYNGSSTLNITSSNIGVNTSTPLSKFTIKNGYSEGISGGFCIDATDGGAYNMVLASYLQGGAQVGYRFTVNNLASTVTNTLCLGYNGYIGIGTQNPGYLLDVNGGLRASNITTSGGYFYAIDPTYYSTASTLNTFAASGGVTNTGGYTVSGAGQIITVTNAGIYSVTCRIHSVPFSATAHTVTTYMSSSWGMSIIGSTSMNSSNNTMSGNGDAYTVCGWTGYLAAGSALSFYSVSTLICNWNFAGNQNIVVIKYLMAAA